MKIWKLNYYNTSILLLKSICKWRILVYDKDLYILQNIQTRGAQKCLKTKEQTSFKIVSRLSLLKFIFLFWDSARSVAFPSFRVNMVYHCTFIILKYGIQNELMINSKDSCKLKVKLILFIHFFILILDVNYLEWFFFTQNRSRVCRRTLCFL